MSKKNTIFKYDFGHKGFLKMVYLCILFSIGILCFGAYFVFKFLKNGI